MPNGCFSPIWLEIARNMRFQSKIWLNQFKFYCVKEMQYIYIVTSRECINNLFFHILNSRQAIFIYSIRSKAVDLFTFFYFINIFVCWILPMLCCWYHSLLFPLFNSYVFQQWWTIVGGIKIVILFYKVHSKPVKNEK